jgi:hypothetical protein
MLEGYIIVGIVIFFSEFNTQAERTNAPFFICFSVSVLAGIFWPIFLARTLWNKYFTP